MIRCGLKRPALVRHLNVLNCSQCGFAGANFLTAPQPAGKSLGGSDESHIQALIAIYKVAAALLNLVGSTASLAVSVALTSDEGSAPLAYKLRFCLVVYAISATFFYALPSLLLWKLYK
jgi:hypothetical protein